jgi:ribose/xylose/arabinose/galactoside ABC-type transport system permease subunit
MNVIVKRPPLPRQQRLVPVGVRLWGRLWPLISPNVAYLALVLLIVVFWILGGDRFMASRNWKTILEQVPVVGVMALGMTFVITAGYIDLSVGSALGLAGLLGAIGAQHFGPSGLVLGLLGGVAVGLGNGLVFARLRIPSFVTTLASMIIVRAIVAIVSGGFAVYLDPGLSGKFDWLNTLGTFPWITLVLLGVFGLMWLLYNQTVFGQNVRAIGGGEVVTRLFGIPIDRYKLLVFMLMGLLVGIASILNLAQLGAASPISGTGRELDVISAVVLGGTPLSGGYGSVTKTMVGALALVVLSDGLTIAGVPPSWDDIVRGCLLIVAIAIAIDRKKIGVVK